MWALFEPDSNRDRTPADSEYVSCIFDLIQHEEVAGMKRFRQHGEINCLQHSLFVSYRSYCMTKRLGIDFRSAARGGLLHDFFLYDWHGGKPYQGFHGFKHAKVALNNACRHFQLNDKEKDIIAKHMWPLNIALPLYRETFVVIWIDKYCAALELTERGKQEMLEEIERLFIL